MHTTSVKIGSSELIFETGRIAKQAHGSVLVSCGETMVLSAVTVANTMRSGQDFFPQKDFAGRRGLLQQVGRRRNLLNYVRKNDIERYRAILNTLGLRK